CDLGALGVGDTAFVTIVAVPSVAVTLVQGAVVTSAAGEPTPGDNTVQTNTPVQTLAAACANRPPVGVSPPGATRGGAPRLRATVTAQASGQFPDNALTSVAFTQLNGALVDVLPSGPTGQLGAFTVPLPGGAQLLQFDVFRTAAGQPAMVRLVATDACGPW